MLREIERKFLVTSDSYKAQAVRQSAVKQGYLCLDPQRTVRVRLKDGRGFITVKSEGSETGLSRFEWEKQIPADEADALLALCDGGYIEKIRHEVRAGDLTWEIDEFFGLNLGLTVAELELPSEDYPFDTPDWLGGEVTGNKKYYNLMLLQHPFTQWTDHD